MFKSLLIDTINYRLPPNLKPYFYELKIKPFIGPTFGNKSYTTEGTTRIHFICQIPTDKVYIHIKEIALKEASIAVSSESNETVDDYFVKAIQYDLIRDFVIIHIDKECTKNNKYILSVDYNGNISSSYGFYRSSYKDPTGQTRQ